MNKRLRKTLERKAFQARMRRSQEGYEREQMEKARKMFDHHQAMLRTNPQIVASVRQHDLEVKQREKEEEMRKLRFKKLLLSLPGGSEDWYSARKRYIDEGYQGINWD